MKHNKRLQSGRSMVEMLGTLAIIGVLSIGGIAGYNYGMNKYKANEVINDVNMRMIDVANHVMRGVQIEKLDSNWGDSRAGYPITIFHDNTNEPSIWVKQVPTDVCQEILKSTPDTQDIFVGSENSEGMDGNWYLGDNEDICEGSDKEMLFALSPEILASFNPQDPEYVEPEGTGTATAPVVTKLECYSNADCNTEKPYCNNSGNCVKCTQDEHCPSENPYCDTTTYECHECQSNDDCTKTNACTRCITPDGQETGFCEYACQELEWIGNEGSSSIFIPLKTNAKDIVEVEQSVQYTDTSFNQAEIKNGSPYFFMGIDGSLNWYAGTGGYGGSGIKADTSWHTMRLVSYGDNHGFWLDGNRLYKGSTNDGAYLPSGFGLWYTVGGSWRTLNRKKYVKVKVNGDAIYDLIPVLDPEGVPAMLDTVENKLYYNQGSGQFSYGE